MGIAATRKSFAFVLALILPTLACAWDGHDYESGADIEIEKGNLVRPGREIEIYDHGTGEYADVEVQSIHRRGAVIILQPLPLVEPQTGKVQFSV